MRRIFAKRTKFFEAKSVDTFNASDSRQSSNAHHKKDNDICYCPFYFELEWVTNFWPNSSLSEERAECEVLLQKEQSSLKQNQQTRLTRATQDSLLTPSYFLCIKSNQKHFSYNPKVNTHKIKTGWHQLSCFLFCRSDDLDFQLWVQFNRNNYYVSKKYILIII